MKRKNIIHILAQERKEPPRKSTGEIVRKNQDLLREVFKGKIPLRKLRFKIEERLAHWKFKESLEDEEKHLRLYRISLMLRFEDLRQYLSRPNINNEDRFLKMYELGAYGSKLRDVEQKIETFDDHRALDIARKLWQDGDQCVRIEMAEYLRDISPELSHDNLEKKLMPLVEKYGRM